MYLPYKWVLIKRNHIPPSTASLVETSHSMQNSLFLFPLPASELPTNDYFCLLCDVTKGTSASLRLVNHAEGPTCKTGVHDEKKSLKIFTVLELCCGWRKGLLSRESLWVWVRPQKECDGSTCLLTSCMGVCDLLCLCRCWLVCVCVCVYNSGCGSRQTAHTWRCNGVSVCVRDGRGLYFTIEEMECARWQQGLNNEFCLSDVCPSLRRWY